jgi:hypothetical protein
VILILAECREAGGEFGVGENDFFRLSVRQCDGGLQVPYANGIKESEAVPEILFYDSVIYKAPVQDAPVVNQIMSRNFLAGVEEISDINRSHPGDGRSGDNIP